MAENTEENANSLSDQAENKQSFGDVDERIPRLVRISSLHPNYERQNQNLSVTPVRLLLEDDLMSMTKGWSQDEQDDERRLVRFKFKRKTPTDYWVTFEEVRKQEFTHEQPIISCIFWKEENLHIVTSVDIILILEYLVEQSFTIEEKNRIRRNLQSLKPYTISRSYKPCQRFFNVLMNMEDPRPRNIEKDLKVFKWSDLFSAFNKVISKYSTSIPKNSPVLGDDEDSHSKYLPAHGDSDILGVSGGGITKSRSDDGLISSSKNSEMSSFLPNERLKILKRKVTQSRNLNQLTINGRHKLFQHAITPTDPIPIRHESDKHNGDFKLDKENNFDSDNSENSINKNTRDYDIRLNRDCYKQRANTIESEPNIQTSIKGDKLPDSLVSQSVTGSELNSALGSYSSVPASISPSSDSTSSNTNTNTNTSTTNPNSNSNESPSGYSSNVFTSASSKSTQLSLDVPHTSSIGANAKQKVLPNQIPDHISKPLNKGRTQEPYSKERHHTPYFQYPSQSRLYNNADYKPLSTNNVRIHEEKTAIGNDKVKLPPIEPSINKLNAVRERGIGLPPITSSSGNQFQFSGPLPGPSEIQSNIEEYRKQPTAVNQQVFSGIEGSTGNLKPINDLFRPPEHQ